MTSNIGFNDESIGFISDKEKVIEEKLKEYFSLPFINRIDNIVLFKSLDKMYIEKIVVCEIEKLKQKYKSKKISIRIKKQVIEQIIEKSNFNNFGARKIKKIIKTYIENQIIDGIMSGKRNINIVNLLQESKIF